MEKSKVNKIKLIQLLPWQKLVNKSRQLVLVTRSGSANIDIVNNRQ